MTDSEHPHNALPRGYRLQEYELVRVLGMGGFGITYLGFDHHLAKAVAIKEYLPSDLATRTTDHSVAPQASSFRGDFQWGLDRFVKEAKTVARFDHRHIIKVYRYFEAHGTAYIVMEYAEGETLADYLVREGPLSEAELREILYPLLDGLAVVHEAGILHRDITPSNIVLRDEDGSPVLIDFGAARQAVGERSRSITSVLTPGYAPIEQYSTRGDSQGAWTDIYALGAVCYRALTGRVPVEALERVRRDRLVSLGELCGAWVSAGLVSSVDWALQVGEEDRPQSVTEWRAMLEAKEAADDLAEAEQPQLLLSATEVALEKQRQEEQAVEEARLAAKRAEEQRREQAELEQRQAEQAEKARLNNSAEVRRRRTQERQPDRPPTRRRVRRRAEARRRRTRERQPYIGGIPGGCGVVVLLVVGLIRSAGIVTADWNAVFVGGVFMAIGTGLVASIFTNDLPHRRAMRRSGFETESVISMLLLPIALSVPLFAVGIGIFAVGKPMGLGIVVIVAIGGAWLLWDSFDDIRRSRKGRK